MSSLQFLHDEIAYRKQEAYQILSMSCNDEEIKVLCRKFAFRDPDLEYKDSSEWYAVAALVSLMSLENTLPPPGKDYSVRDEDMAKFVIDGMNAMLCLINAGWKPSESYAELALKMKRGQPPTRKRENIERDDIEEFIEEFRDVKGFYPKDTRSFLGFLERKGYLVDYSDGRVHCPPGGEWKKPRAIGTIENQLREKRRRA